MSVDSGASAYSHTGWPCSSAEGAVRSISLMPSRSRPASSARTTRALERLEQRLKDREALAEGVGGAEGLDRGDVRPSAEGLEQGRPAAGAGPRRRAATGRVR